LLATAVARLAHEAGCTAVVDVGAGRGELLTALADRGGEWVADLRLHGVDLVRRPAGLPDAIGWSSGLDQTPDAALDGALVIGWELLDVVPATVAEVDQEATIRTVLVHPTTGEEVLGPPLTGVDASWCARWWPLDGASPGTRAEVGGQRDALWAKLTRRVTATPRGGLLLAVDYAHNRADRPPQGSLTGYRAGRQVPPVPDGSCDLTAHVALDAVAAACRDAGTGEPLLGRQRELLQALGVTAARQAAAPGSSGGELLQALARRSQAAELLDPGGLGGFGWLLQPAGRPNPLATA
jgi:SAM-dependent MidA family methyltransferase